MPCSKHLPMHLWHAGCRRRRVLRQPKVWGGPALLALGTTRISTTRPTPRGHRAELPSWPCPVPAPPGAGPGSADPPPPTHLPHHPLNPVCRAAQRLRHQSRLLLAVHALALCGQARWAVWVRVRRGVGCVSVGEAPEGSLCRAGRRAGEQTAASVPTPSHHSHHLPTHSHHRSNHPARS